MGGIPSDKRCIRALTIGDNLLEGMSKALMPSANTMLCAAAVTQILDTAHGRNQARSGMNPFISRTPSRLRNLPVGP